METGSAEDHPVPYGSIIWVLASRPNKSSARSLDGLRKVCAVRQLSAWIRVSPTRNILTDECIAAIAQILERWRAALTAPPLFSVRPLTGGGRFAIEPPSRPAGYNIRRSLVGQVAEWLKAADCKSARVTVRWFESSPVHHLPASVGGPFRRDDWSLIGALSSVGRASRLHREGQRFEPVSAHQPALA